MTVDFPSSYPPPISSVGRPVDGHALQEAFVAVLRSYGIESPANTTLEILRSNSQAGNAVEHDRNQQRRDNQHNRDRNDYTQIDRKLLDKSEIRHGEINSDYRNHTDRLETLQNDYLERIERTELSQSVPADTATRVNLPLAVTKSDEPPPIRDPIKHQQNNAAEIRTANGQPLAASPKVPVESMGNATAEGMVPMSGNAPALMPASASPPSVPLQMFTLFTPSGRFGQFQEKADERENEDEKDEKEEHAEKRSIKKQQPFAALEMIRTEAARPPKRQQQKEPRHQAETSQIAEQPRAKPKANEPEQSSNVNILEELLNAPQSVSASNKAEPNQPNSQHYLRRIAAACEAAAQYAPIRIKVNLDQLGTLALRFYTQSDKLMLRFETPTAKTALFLREHLEGLRTILAKRNVRIAAIEITPDSSS